MAGVGRMEIKNLQLNSQNSIIIGVIISSMNPKQFEPRNQKFGNGGMRAVWTFTLRDSPEDIINVTVWGGVEYINRMYKTFQVGKIAEVINGKVETRKLDSVNEMYVPTATSPYAIVVNEGVALVQLHDSPASTGYLSLLRKITKPISQVQLLIDVLNNIDELRDKYIDLLVLVTFVGQAQNITTRKGKSLSYRIIEVRDSSIEDAVQLRLWEDEWIRMSEVWEPNHTILFMADTLVTFNTYKKQNAITIVRKTLLIEDPDVTESTALRSAIRNKSGPASSDPFTLPNPKMITSVMKIHEITQKLNEASLDDTNRLQLLAVVVANVTEINVDADEDSIILNKCALCKKTVLKENDSCMNLNCPSGNGIQVPQNVAFLNLKVHLKDETGYLIGCKLYGSAAENAIGQRATEIQKLSKQERSQLKWNLMFLKYEVRLQILGPTNEYPRAIYNILSMESTDSQNDLFKVLVED